MAGDGRSSALDRTEGDRPAYALIGAREVNGVRSRSEAGVGLGWRHPARPAEESPVSRAAVEEL